MRCHSFALYFTLPLTLLIHFPFISRALGQNPLHCDCNLSWLQVFLRLRFLDNGVAICSNPEEMKFKSVFHANPSNFICPTESSEVALKCDPCGHNPCLNGGKCEAITSVEFKCACEAPFYGERCESKIDACFTKPCKNGGICKVIDDIGHYR